MKKNIKDYLHLYLGCQVMLWAEATNPNFKPEKRKLVIEDGRYLEITLKEALFCGAKPILRPFYQLTQEIEYKGEKFIPLVKLKTHGVNGYESLHHWDGEYCKVWDKEGHSLVFSKYDGLLTDYRGNKGSSYNPEKYRQLLEWGFDLFGLIESGLAIDATTLTTPQN